MIRIDIAEDTVSPALTRLAELLDDLSPAMRQIGTALLVSTRERFGSSKSPDGTAWAPKSPVTLEAYRRRGDRGGSTPLIGPSRRLGREILIEADAASVAIGSNLIYAAVMQFGAGQGAFGRTSRGAPIPWGTIPARPFLGLSESDESKILEIVGEHLARAVSAP